ncbi:mechanosensitive ion channel [Argonema antarcticum]|uniref:mechanosensitive ion channel n=1 Tax=Argonema antarcticum TaxID=2942763 RepID=UPI0020120863|nr:mechanosensitive ion channel [Argonema antarcticum]MCL1470882.1 mechanosensitive ion channel [Argonema antarcticum A004/B2]
MNGIWQGIGDLGVSVPMLSHGILAQVQRRPAPAPPPGRVAENSWNGFSQQMAGNFGEFVPNLLGAIAILVVGVLIAFIGAALTRGLLNRTNIDNKLAAWITGRQSETEGPPIEKWISDAVFWLIFIFTLVAFLQALQLTAVSEPLNNLLNQVFIFLPKLAAAGILLGVAWLLATLIKLVVTRGLRVLRLDERLNQQVEGEAQSQFSLSETIGNTLYWFIFLLFLPSILSTLELQGTLQPVQQLLNNILSILPNIFAAIVIAATGWLVAQVVRRIVTNLLTASGADRLGAQFGVNRATTGQSLSGIIGTVVYVLILIPTAIAALNALKIEAISAPAIEMLNQILSAIPKIFTAALILIVAYVIGKFVADLLTNILTSIGFNNIFNWLGLGVTVGDRRRIIIPPSGAPVPDEAPYSPEEPGTVLQPSPVTTRTPSEVVGIVALVGIMLLAIVPATEVLEFAALTTIVTSIIAVSGRILAGLVVFAIGLYLANLAFNLITSSGGQQARILGHTARIAIIALVSAMALQQMGIASDIVNLAFGLLLGAIAVAIALAFGLGSRDIAADQVREWLGSFRNQKDKPPHF